MALRGNLARCSAQPYKRKGRRSPTTSPSKYVWLRGRATRGTCSCGAARRRRVAALDRGRIAPTSMDHLIWNRSATDSRHLLNACCSASFLFWRPQITSTNCHQDGAGPRSSSQVRRISRNPRTAQVPREHSERRQSLGREPHAGTDGRSHRCARYCRMAAQVLSWRW
jgi:hypothetical protein